MINVSIELGISRLSASQLKDGEVVHFTGSTDLAPNPLTSNFIRFVTSKGLFDFYGARCESRDSASSIYTKLPTGTKITLEVTE